MNARSEPPRALRRLAAAGEGRPPPAALDLRLGLLSCYAGNGGAFA